MQLRRFTADSTPAALSAVRLALGDDAIILANRRLDDQVEIIATGQMEDVASMSDAELSQAVASSELIDEQSELDSPVTTSSLTNEAPETDSSSDGMAKEQIAAGAATINAQSDSLITQLSEDIESISVDVPALKLQAPHSVKPDTVQLSASARARSDAHTDSNQQAAEYNSAESKNISDDSENNRTLSTVEANSLFLALEKQSAQIDQRFRGLEVNLWGSCAPNRSLHLRRLFGLGIGAELAVRLVERVDADMSVDDALRQSFAMLKSTLPIGNDKTLSEPGVTIMSGPPGAGKTTALIKLATQHVKQHGNQSIVIICADTRRIGAFDELQAYGRLLGVPTVHAHDASELNSLMDAFTHKQLVLIDYTLPDGEGVIELPDRLQNKNDDSVRQLFVMPASLQSATADALISRYCTGHPVQCVLTHLDTNARLGELFNALIRHHLPVAYWSDSPSVQLPLQRADASVLVATAVAMSRRLEISPDDEWLQKLIQPANQLLNDSLMDTVNQGAQQL
ncbi:MAG: zeta toxin family protein [Granulosicoccus sp.]